VRVLAAAIVLALMALVAPSMAWAQKAVPQLTDRVVDLAGMINGDDEARLVARLEAHEKATSNQVVVLAIDSLDGDSLEEYSLRVARTWALGQKERNNGVLFLIAKNDRKMRIEVGYGLEGTLTDAVASFIIRQTVTPLFKQGLFNGGIVAGTGQIIDVLESDETALQEWKDRANSSDPEWPFYIFIAIWVMIFFGSIVSNILVRMFGREIKPGHYRWLGMDAGPNAPKPRRSSRSGGGWSGGSSSGGGGFSGGGGSFGGGGSSGGW
jgi:uncharacterized protein